MARADSLPIGTWISINATSGEIVINATLPNVGNNQMMVTAIDANGAAFSQPLNIIINQAPFINGTIGTLLASENIPFAFILPVTTFIDPDEQNLTITCLQSNGSALPSWLSFDPISWIFSGTPASSDIGTITLGLYATDTFGDSSPTLDVNLVV